MTETPKIEVPDLDAILASGHASIASAFASLRKTLNIPDIEIDEDQSPEDGSEEEETHYPIDEAIRVLKKIEANVDNGFYENESLIAVADRYIHLAEVFGVDI